MLPVNQCYYKLTQNIKLLRVKNKSFPLKNIHVTTEAKAGSSSVHKYLVFSQRTCFLFKHLITQEHCHQSITTCFLTWFLSFLRGFLSVLNTGKQCTQSKDEIPPTSHVLLHLRALSELLTPLNTHTYMWSGAYPVRGFTVMATWQSGGTGQCHQPGSLLVQQFWQAPSLTTF